MPFSAQATPISASFQAGAWDCTGCRDYSGRSRALDLLVLGSDFGAERAYELGLITKVVPRAALMDEAIDAATRIAGASPNALLAIRQAVNFNLRHSWDEMAEYEEQLSRSVFAHPDAAEGMSAMLEKRKPNFRDL